MDTRHSKKHSSRVVSRKRQPFQYDAVASIPGAPESPVPAISPAVIPNVTSAFTILDPHEPRIEVDGKTVSRLPINTIIRPLTTSGDSSVDVIRRALNPAATSACGGGRDPTLSDNVYPPNSSDAAFPPSNGSKGNLMLRELSRRDSKKPQTMSVSYRKNRGGVSPISPVASHHSPITSQILPDTLAKGQKAGISSLLSVEARSPESSSISVNNSVQNVHQISSKRDIIQATISPKWNILIVDDSPLNRKMLMKTLRAAGHTCEEAENGQDAIVMVQRRVDNGRVPYDVILMDFVMPVMNGPTATKVMSECPYP